MNISQHKLVVWKPLYLLQCLDGGVGISFTTIGTVGVVDILFAVVAVAG